MKLDGTEHRAELKRIFTESSKLLAERLQRLAVLDTYVQAGAGPEEPEAEWVKVLDMYAVKMLHETSLRRRYLLSTMAYVPYGPGPARAVKRH